MGVSASLLCIGVAERVVEEENMLLRKGSNRSLEYMVVKPLLVAPTPDIAD
jgi:hypothetical protein